MGAGARLLVNIVVVSLAVLGGVYQAYLKPLLANFGVWPTRAATAIGNQHCTVIPELEACEESILHQSSGIFYAACSTPRSRAHWIPAMDQLNSTGASTEDYIATYNPATGHVSRLTRSDFNAGRGLSLHGMDVVASATDPNILYIYLVNHRVPLGVKSARDVGADSVIEIFSTTVGGTEMRHLYTVEEPAVVITPNSVSGSADGKSFYFTNDHAVRVGASRLISNILGRNKTSIGYCHIDEGCKFAATGLHAINGIVSAENGTIYAADSLGGCIEVFEKSTNSGHTLRHSDSICTGHVLDNVSLDADGHVWVAAIPVGWKALRHMKTPSLTSPSSVFKLAKYTGRRCSPEQQYTVTKVFEDDGNIRSGITTAVYDSKRRKIFMSGIASPHSVVCDL